MDRHISHFSCFPKVVSFIALLSPILAWGHSGSLDDRGGHTQRSTGTYHCHQEPCLFQHRQVEKATQEAKSETQAFIALYDRNDWPHWSDFDKDCQDTRAEVLIQTSRILIKYRRNKTCDVHAGEWVDPYTGKRWTLASDLDTDHIVPLKWAHQHGGAAWDREQKERFANDVENLLAVEDNINQSKGAKGPDKWMPPMVRYHCQYLKVWGHILAKYKLSFTLKEQHTIQTKYAQCPL